MQQRSTPSINQLPWLMEDIVSNTEIESGEKAQKIKCVAFAFDTIEEYPLDRYVKEGIFECAILVIALNLKQDLKEARTLWKKYISSLEVTKKEITWTAGFVYIINQFLKSSAKKLISDIEKKLMLKPKNNMKIY